MSWELDGVPIPKEIAILRKMYCLYVKAILSKQEHVQSHFVVKIITLDM